MYFYRNASIIATLRQMATMPVANKIEAVLNVLVALSLFLCYALAPYGVSQQIKEREK